MGRLARGWPNPFVAPKLSRLYSSDSIASLEQRVQAFEQLRDARLDNECWCALYVNLEEIISVFGLAPADILDVPLDRKREIWDAYVEYKEQEHQRVELWLQELLNTPQQQRSQQHGVNWEQQASVASPSSAAPAVTPSAVVVLNEEPLPLWVKFMPWFGAGLMAVSSICWLIEIGRPVQAVAQYSQPLAHYQQQAPQQPSAAKPSTGQQPQVQSVLGDARLQDWVNWCAANNQGRGWPGGEVHVCEAIHRQLGYVKNEFQ